MNHLRCPAAYVDFSFPEPLNALAAVLSLRIFAGIAFIGEDEGIWDEIPALRLEQDFLGLRVELGGRAGKAGGYTLQIEAIDFPWNRVPPGENAELDLSAFLALVLSRIEGIEILEPG